MSKSFVELVAEQAPCEHGIWAVQAAGEYIVVIAHGAPVGQTEATMILPGDEFARPFVPGLWDGFYYSAYRDVRDWVRSLHKYERE